MLVVPTEEEIEVKEGKRRTVERRVVSGYILVNMLLSEESWYVVRNTPGGDPGSCVWATPPPLCAPRSGQIIKQWKPRPRGQSYIQSGERVRIVDGPSTIFAERYPEIDMERAKVRVMVNFFGANSGRAGLLQ